MARHRNRPLIEPFLWWLVVPGILLVGIGFLLASWYDTSHRLVTKLLSVGVTELGFAFLIAAIVYVVFEETVKRDDAKGIAAFLYGIETDSTYFQMIEDYIIRCPFYRFGTTITYKFKEKSQESFLIDYVIEYKLKNVSKVKKKFRVSGEVETRPIHLTSANSDWEIGKVVAEVTQNKVKVQPKLSLRSSQASPHTMAFASPDFLLKSRECIHVKIQHQIEKHDHDTDVWQAALPSSGVKLRIEWRKEWGLRFADEAFHPNSDDLVRECGEDGETCWRELTLDEPFMARHGFRFWWSSSSQPNEQVPLPPPKPIPDSPGPVS